LDNSGNLYIADFDNMRIRVVQRASGIISTYAGNGNSADSGDGGPATAAGVHGPSGMVFDASNNMYLPEWDGSTVRLVTSDGIISTYAGKGDQKGYSGDLGPATSALLNQPTGVALDSVGNLYIADYFNCRIRLVVKTTGIITTGAGNGVCGFGGDSSSALLASLNCPRFVTLDSYGNLYFTEQGGNRVRFVTNTGIISTIAGTGVAGSVGDGGPATLAQVNGPAGIAVDVDGNIFFSEWGGNKVRTIQQGTGIISTYAGMGYPGSIGDHGYAALALLHGLDGIVFDSNRNLFISDVVNYRIRVVSPSITQYPVSHAVNCILFFSSSIRFSQVQRLITCLRSEPLLDCLVIIFYFLLTAQIPTKLCIRFVDNCRLLRRPQLPNLRWRWWPCIESGL
jgi:trimeric autotransporter adhesin